MFSPSAPVPFGEALLTAPTVALPADPPVGAAAAPPLETASGHTWCKTQHMEALSCVQLPACPAANSCSQS
jgi:hypothetical protein